VNLKSVKNMINSDLNLHNSFALLWMGRRGHRRRYGVATWALAPNIETTGRKYLFVLAIFSFPRLYDKTILTSSLLRWL